MPVWFIILIVLEFAWLFYETRCFTIRLYRGAAPKPERYYGRSEVHELAKRIGWTFKPYKGAMSWQEMAKEWVSPICGWDWIFEHEHDLDDYSPTVELYYGNGYKQTFTLKPNHFKVMREIMRINTGKKYFKQLMAEESRC